MRERNQHGSCSLELMAGVGEWRDAAIVSGGQALKIGEFIQIDKLALEEILVVNHRREALSIYIIAKLSNS